MIIIITGASHTGKTLLAQRMLEKYKYPYLSVDHLKMGLIRSGNTALTPEGDDALTGYLWPIVREMIKTAIENKQNLVVEGCYIPFNWRGDFGKEYIADIRFICLAFTGAYVDAHFEDIKAHASDIEARLCDECDIEGIKADNRRYTEGFRAAGERVALIDGGYEETINAIINYYGGSMTIETERLILRPWEDSDAEDLYEYAKDERVGPAAGWQVHTSVENSREIIRTVLSDPETYAVCLKGDNRPIGSIGLFKPEKTDGDIADGDLEVGFWVAVPFWGNGYIPEAVRALQKRAFTELGCEALWCGYYDGNVKSKRVQEKCGFVYDHTEEGKWCLMLGEQRTEHFGRITKAEWELRSRLNVVDYFSGGKREHWLAQIAKSDWGAGAFLHKLLSEGGFFDAVGSKSHVLLLTDGDELVSYCTYAEKDDIQPTELTPWVGFVYTFPPRRGHRFAGRLLDEAGRLAKNDGFKEFYISTNHVGLYEKYGCEYKTQLIDIDGNPSRVYVKKIR